MATTIDKSFTDYASNLEITDKQTSLVSTRRSNVVKAIGDKLVLNPDSPSLLIGSYDRNTLIRYLSQDDIDVMVVLHYSQNKSWFDEPSGTTKVLDKFKAILDEAYPDTEKRRDRNCITMKFSEFRLDVVPAYYNNGGYYQIPDSIRVKWVPTNPIKFAECITSVNKAMSGSFVPLIKMIKGWNRDKNWPLASFHLECMLYNHFRYYSTNPSYPYLAKTFFDSLPSYLGSITCDPIMGDQVDSYLDNAATITNRQLAIQKANDAKAKADEAYDDQSKYPSIAIGEWKTVFGEFFPAYG